MSFADAHKDAVLERVAVEPAVSGHALCEAITYVADDAVITACEEALRRAPLGEGGGGADGPRVLPERWAVMALGGYGRGQMCLRSDVDIQLVVPDGSADPGPFMVALLDHLTRHRLKTGHGVRTLSESLMLSRTEYTFATATLTARHLIGDPTVTEAVRAPVYHHLSGPGLASLVEALEIDREKRIRRHGDTVYLLEPDLKQGVGGLRDAQLVGWLGLVTGRIYDRAVMLAEDLLLKVRQVVHAVATFKCDRLAFEYQDEVADRLGLRAAPGEDPSVELMRQVHLAMRLLDGRARRHLEYARGRVQAPRRRRLVGHPGFVQLGGRLARADGAPPRTAAEAVEAVEAAARTGLPFEAGLEDGLETVARRLGPGGRESPQLNGLLLDLLLSPTTEASAALHLLHHTGLLTAVVPEFAPVQGRINRDLYHVFTVDEHILAVVDKLKAIGRGDHSDDHPLATRAWAHLDAERRPLVVAALLHDVGKGYGPGHHERGAELATQVAPRLGLTATETTLTRRLIRHQADMALICMRRDLGDPRPIRTLARVVGDRATLDALYLLTLADWSSVGPRAFVGWHRQLLDSLYHRTAALLQTPGPFADPTRLSDELREHLLREELGAVPEAPSAESRPVEDFLGGLPTRYFATVRPGQARRHYQLWRQRVAEGGAVVDIAHEAGSDHAEITVLCGDRRGALVQLSASLAASRYGVMSAEIYSLGEGTAMHVFRVLDAGRRLAQPQPIRAMEQAMRAALGGDAPPIRRDRITLRSLGFLPPIVAKVSPSNEVATEHTVFDVVAGDRDGLLHDIAAFFDARGLRVELAFVTTLGRRAHDSFYVVDGGGAKLDGEEASRLGRELGAALVELDPRTRRR